MRKFGSILLGMVAGILLTVGLLWVGSGGSVMAQSRGDFRIGHVDANNSCADRIWRGLPIGHVNASASCDRRIGHVDANASGAHIGSRRGG